MRFGSRRELQDLIAAGHSAGLHVIADMVVNHNSGADAEELNPTTGRRRWTLFSPASV